MIIKSLLLALVLSLEATLGLPLFFLYFFWLWTDRWSVPQAVLAQLVASWLLAIFYSLSWPLLASLLLASYMFKQQFYRLSQPARFWLAYLLVLGTLIYLLQLHWQLLHLGQAGVWLGYLWYQRRFKWHSSNLLSK